MYTSYTFTGKNGKAYTKVYINGKFSHIYERPQTLVLQMPELKR